MDIRSLVTSVVATQAAWPDAVIERIVYCTARVDAATNPSAQADQDVYLQAIRATSSVDHIEFGNYVSRVKTAPLAIWDPAHPNKRRPLIVRSSWPVMVQDDARQPIPDAAFVVSYLHNEEKGSDVNLATHLTLDVVQGNVDAAVVVSNDSDLRLPVSQARERVPVGIINPRGGQTAGDLRGQPDDGVGGHWWRRLRSADFVTHQLANPAGGYVKPTGW
jgi:uncharacterized LabA/DUF88 family protein